MSKNEKILFELLKLNGFNPQRVWYESNFSWHPDRGWYALMENGEEYKLSRNYDEAKANIENKTIKKTEI